MGSETLILGFAPSVPGETDFKSRPGIRGVVGLEIMVVVVVLLALLTIAVPLFLQRNPVDENGLTFERAERIKRAMVGDPHKVTDRARTDFGFVGDLGILPANLDELRVQGAYPVYQLDTNVYFGWRGEYVEATALLDAWGRAFVYRDPPAPTTWVKEIRSAGVDGILDNADDVWVRIDENEVSNPVSGTFFESGIPRVNNGYVGTLMISFPIGTAMTTIPAAVAAGTYGAATRIPIGLRYFETQDGEYRKIASLNGLGNSIVNFIGAASATNPFTPYENPFDSEDGLTYLGGGSGQWRIGSIMGRRYLYTRGRTTEGNRVAVLDGTEGSNYRITVRVFIGNSSQQNAWDGFGIDYRANYSGSATPTSGYRFKYYPEDSPNPSCNLTRYATAFIGSTDYSINSLSNGFGMFTITLEVEDVGATVEHRINIQRRFNGNYQTTFVETDTGNSSPSGLVSLLIWGQNGSIRIHHINIDPL
ncbi:MAG: hypothetical protein GY765_30750 [bacterium]|nr:hypothetical protein [bacterium]